MTPRPWPADAVERRPISSLVPYARNARTHTDEDVALVGESMRRFGWTNPVLIDEAGGIIAGHCRVMAAQRIGLTDVPVMVARGWSEAERRAYVLADNQLAARAGWDQDLLRSEAQWLAGVEFDMNLLGWNPDDLAELMADPPTEGECDPEETPDPPADPASRLGDVWILGRHRIICGSSTDADTVARVLNGVKPHLMITDPPYGVEYDANWRNEAARNSKSGMGNCGIGAGATGKVLNDDKADWRESWALFPGDVAYVWHAGLFAGVVADSLVATGFKLRSQIIWAKSSFAIGRGDYHWQHEPAWYAVRDGKTGHYGGDRTQSTLWSIPKPARSETGHSTQKPVECMARPMLNNSSPGQAVYEPFSGSGTTIIAGEMNSRSVHAVELNPAYIDVAVLRWQEFTGGGAVLEGDGRTFSEVRDAGR